MTQIPVEQLPPELQVKAAVAEQDVPQVVDYFAFDETHWVTLPDGVQRIEVKVLNEGARRRYLNQTNRDVRMNSRTKEMVMRSAVGDDEKVLLTMAVVGWDVTRGGEPVPFSPRNFEQALDKWPPLAWKPVVKKIREVNDWLLGSEDDLESMEEEYRELGDRIEKIKTSVVKD